MSLHKFSELPELFSRRLNHNFEYLLSLIQPIKGEGSPYNKITPSVIGQLYEDTLTRFLYRSNGTNPRAWEIVVSEDITEDNTRYIEMEPNPSNISGVLNTVEYIGVLLEENGGNNGRRGNIFPNDKIFDSRRLIGFWFTNFVGNSIYQLQVRFDADPTLNEKPEKVYVGLTEIDKSIEVPLSGDNITGYYYVFEDALSNLNSDVQNYFEENGGFVQRTIEFSLDPIYSGILIDPEVNGADLSFTLQGGYTGANITGLTETGVHRIKSDGSEDSAVSIVESSEGVYVATFGDDISSGDQIFVKDQGLWVESEVYLVEIPPLIISLTVSDDGGSLRFYGYNALAGYGDVEPKFIEGEEIRFFECDTNPSPIRTDLYFFGALPYTILRLTHVDSGNVYDLAGSAGAYELQDNNLGSLIVSNVGNTIDFEAELIL